MAVSQGDSIKPRLRGSFTIAGTAPSAVGPRFGRGNPTVWNRFAATPCHDPRTRGNLASAAASCVCRECVRNGSLEAVGGIAGRRAFAIARPSWSNREGPD